jgi:hypothetical protein
MNMSADISQISYVDKLTALAQVYFELGQPLPEALRAAEADL